MPVYELEVVKSEKVDTATFDKKDDYIVINLKGDLLKTNHLVHKLHGKKLIDKKLATEVKDVKLVEREVEASAIKIKVD